MRRRLVLSVGAPLAAGVLVYLLLRPSRAWFVALALDVPGFGGALRAVRRVTVPAAEFVPPLLLDTLPDLAWAMALGALLAIVWRDRDRTSRIAWGVAGAAAGLGYEVAQRWHVVPGTFDPWDLVAIALGYAIGWGAHARRRA